MFADKRNAEYGYPTLAHQVFLHSLFDKSLILSLSLYAWHNFCIAHGGRGKGNLVKL